MPNTTERIFRLSLGDRLDLMRLNARSLAASIQSCRAELFAQQLAAAEPHLIEAQIVTGQVIVQIDKAIEAQAKETAERLEKALP